MVITPLDPDVVAADLRPPPLSELAHRARRRAWRRHTVAGAGGGIAVIATAAALIAALLPGGGPTGPATGSGLLPPLTADPVVLDRDTVVWVGQTGCGATVRLTTDRGRTWTPAGGPPALERCTPGVTAMPVMTVTVLDARTYRIVIEGTPWFTRDAGRTWATPPRDEVTVDTIPPGRRGVLPCGDGCDRVRVVDPATGAVLTLRGGLPLDRVHSVYVSDAGGLWAVGAAGPGLGPRRFIRSEDGGRTWSPPMALPTDDEHPILVPADPRTAYVLGHGTGEGSTPRLYRTADGGATWTPIDLPADVVHLAVAAGRPVLLSVKDGQVQAFTGLPFTGPVTVTRGDPLRGGAEPGLAWAAGNDKVVHLTDDGITWHPVTPPD